MPDAGSKKHASDDDQRFPSGSWRGYWLRGRLRGKMELDLTFGEGRVFVQKKGTFYFMSVRGPKSRMSPFCNDVQGEKDMSRHIRLATILTLVLLAVSSVIALEKQPEKQPPAKPKIATQTVTLERGGAKFNCYLARPDTDAPAPGILLIHEWWGLNDWVKRQADRFAEKGYVAMALDLYHGEVAKDAEHAHELMRGLADERAIGDLRFAFEFLSGHKYTKGKKTGVIGWCMGGGFALKLAIEEPRLACTVICYGKPVTDVNQLKRIKGPILGIWGATDRGIEVEPFKRALAEAKVNATHHVYPGAGHGFLNENNQRGYNKEQAEKAWREIEGFLENEPTN